MKLSPSHRARVVELLRCAADLSQRRPFPFNTAAEWTDNDKGQVYWIASDALDAFAKPGTRWCSVENALEAARRVEEGSWP